MRALAVTAIVAATAAAASALILGACSSDSFTTPDGGDDATADRTPPPDASDGGVDAPIDAGPKSWCAKFAADATACADFDGVDAANALAPTWSLSGVNNASLAVGPAPPAQPINGDNPSSPNQLSAFVGPPDGGLSFANLSAAGITNASVVTLEFDFQRPSTTGTNGQVVEFARVEVQNSNPLDSVVLRFVLEQQSWQARGEISGGIQGFINDPIGFGEWHRIQLRLEASGYTIFVDKVPAVSGAISKPWPTGGASYGRIGASELVTVNNPWTAWFDDVVWRSN